MYSKGCITISTRHVTGDRVIFNDFASPGNSLMETTMAPLICMLETWSAYQDIYNGNGNILR